jgi:hypothetical protein
MHRELIAMDRKKRAEFDKYPLFHDSSHARSYKRQTYFTAVQFSLNCRSSRQLARCGLTC